MNAIFISLSESVPYIHEEVVEPITTESSDEDFILSVW